MTDTWRPRLVVLDLDGTTVGMNQMSPTPRVVRAVRDTVAAGVPVVIATGRPVWSALPITSALGFDEPQSFSMVCSNGAVVYDIPSGWVVHQETIEVGSALRALAAARPHAGFAVEHGLLGYRYTKAFVRDFPSTFLQEVELDELADTPTTRLSGRLPGVPIQWVHTRCEIATEWVSDAGLDPAEYSLEIGFSGWVDVCAPGVSKASGVTLLARNLGVAPDDVLTIGDGTNDLSLFAWAGRSIAMGQASPEVRAAADEVTGSVADDGVALALERWFG